MRRRYCYLAILSNSFFDNIFCSLENLHIIQLALYYNKELIEGTNILVKEVPDHYATHLEYKATHDQIIIQS
jgi:hypothetical protein